MVMMKVSTTLLSLGFHLSCLCNLSVYCGFLFLLRIQCSVPRLVLGHLCGCYTNRCVVTALSPMSLCVPPPPSMSSVLLQTRVLTHTIMLAHLTLPYSCCEIVMFPLTIRTKAKFNCHSLSLSLTLSLSLCLYLYLCLSLSLSLSLSSSFPPCSLSHRYTSTYSPYFQPLYRQQPRQLTTHSGQYC